jgi:fucose permease
VAGTFYVYTVPSIVFLLAMVPLLLTGRYGRARLESPPPVLQPPVDQVLADFRNPAAVLLSLLLFFQFGNEWAIAGWLPIFLIQRIGTSPATAIWMLSLFWTALLAGRVLAQPVLPRLDHRKFLLMSVLSAMFGCLMLRFTNNAFGAGVGVLLAGIGFAAIYPLVVEMIGARFPYYHPGIFNGIFSIAVTGGFLAPATLGYFASWLGVSVVMWLPMAGAFLVFFIVLLIWLEARLSGAR